MNRVFTCCKCYHMCTLGDMASRQFGDQPRACNFPGEGRVAEWKEVPIDD